MMRSPARGRLPVVSTSTTAKRQASSAGLAPPPAPRGRATGSMRAPPRERRAPGRPGSWRGPRRGRSEVVAPEGQRHAARAAPAPHQLAAFDGDDAALTRLETLLAREEVDRLHDAEPGVLQLGERRFVAL